MAAWTDAASEDGVQLQPVTDREFLALGAKALKYGWLVLPDVLHPVATEALLMAVRDDTTQKGSSLKLHDFGIFPSDGKPKRPNPIPRARLSDLASVDYGLHHALRKKSTLAGLVATIGSYKRVLEVPPAS
jgi:hypothetical protein